MSDAILYTRDDHCFDSMVLRWLVLEKEAPVVIKRLWSATMHTVEPPYLLDRDLQLFDHWVILQYLQERYPGETLLPIDPQVRAQIRQICALVRDHDVTAEEVDAMLTHGQPFLLGDTFTLADIYVGTRFDYCAEGRRLEAYIDRLGLRKQMQEAR